MTNVSFARVFTEAEVPQRMWDIGERRSYASGEVVLAQHAPVRGVHLVISGALTGFGDSVEGRRVTMSSMGPGSLLGEADVFTGAQRSSGSYLAVHDCELLFMNRDRFLSCMDDAAFSTFVAQSLARKYVAACAAYGSMAEDATIVRIGRMLLAMDEHYGVEHDGLRVIDYRLTQQDIADFLCLSRLSVNKGMRTLAREGLVVRVNGAYCVRNRAKLAAYVRKIAGIAR